MLVSMAHFNAFRVVPHYPAPIRGSLLLLLFPRLIRLEFVKRLQTRGTHMDGFACGAPEFTL